jgi:hypothetical protein
MSNFSFDLHNRNSLFEEFVPALVQLTTDEEPRNIFVQNMGHVMAASSLLQSPHLHQAKLVLNLLILCNKSQQAIVVKDSVRVLPYLGIHLLIHKLYSPLLTELFSNFAST